MRRAIRGMGALAILMTAAFVLGGTASAVHPPPTTTYTVTLSEHGLPSGTSWSVYFGGTTYASATTNLTITGVSAGSYYFYAANPVSTITTGVEYTLQGFTSGYMAVPAQMSQTFSYIKTYQVSFAESPSSSGSIYIGGNNMYSSSWFTTGREVPIMAQDAVGFTFSGWSASSTKITFGSKTTQSTTMIITGTGTVTAKFKPVAYAITYNEVGLPTGTKWSVVSGGVTYSSTTSTLAVGKVGAGYLGVSVPVVSVGGWTQYAPLPYAGSLQVPYITTETISYVKQYQVDLLTSGSGSVSPSGLNYFTAGTNVSITSYGTGSSVFSSWSASPSANIGFGSKALSSTNITVKGPANVTATFTSGIPCTSCKVTVAESGLPIGVTWSIVYNGTWYTNTVSATSNTISVSGVTSTIYFQTAQYVSPGGSSGALYSASSTYFGIGAPSQLGYTLIYTKVFYLTFTTAGAGSLGQGSGWYPAGYTWSIWGTTNGYDQFSKWSSTAKADKIGKSTSQGTTVLVAGPGTITLTFKVPTSKVVFTEVGLPSGTSWTVSFGGAVYGSNTATITLPAVAWGGYGWGVYTPLTGSSWGTAWAAFDNNYYGLGGTMYVPYQTTQTIYFQGESLVSIYATGTSGGSVSPSGSTWIPNGWVIPATAINGTSVTFSSWSSNTTGVTVGVTSWPSTYITVTGPGTLSAKFV